MLKLEHTHDITKHESLADKSCYCTILSIKHFNYLQ